VNFSWFFSFYAIRLRVPQSSAVDICGKLQPARSYSVKIEAKKMPFRA